MSTKGVTYIKINRIDNEGNDNTLTLQGLTNIRIKYSDIGVKEYPVYTIAEYPDYYLYQLYTTDITSSTDNNILDYKCEATDVGPAAYTGNGILQALQFDSVIIDSQNNFQLPNNYNFDVTTNIPITVKITASGFTEIGGGTVLAPTKINLESNTQGVLTSLNYAQWSSDINLTYTGFFQTNEIISAKILYSTSPTTKQVSFSGLKFIVTQSIPPTSSLNQVVLEPYVTENFEFSDCNVLYGNVDSYPFNPLYMDVDYSTNGMIAINTDQIISGDATRSTVKPYYYSLRRHIRPRYNGSENIDPGAWIFTGGSEAIGIGFKEYTLTSNNSHQFKVGDKIIIYQGKTLKGIATIQKIPNSISVVVYSSEIVLDTFTVNLQIRIVAGLTYLTPNTFENSNVFPLDTFNSEIFEYRYGTTTFPEIPNAGMLVMGNILEVADQNNVNILQQGSQYFEAYNKIINDTFTPNTILSDIRQYGDGKQVLLNNLQVITSDFGTPKSPLNDGDINEYWIPTNGVAANVMASMSAQDTLSILNSYGAYEIELNELGQYITASSGLIPSHSVINNITSSLSRGERWFVTIYNRLPNPLDQTSLSSFQANSVISYTPTNDPSFPLVNRGIFEIISGSGTDLILNVGSTAGLSGVPVGNGNKGIFLWKATTPSPKQGKYVIVSKPNVNELGPGAIVLPDSNDAINNYYNEITTTYGTNTKPPTNQSSKGPSPGSSGLSR